MSETHPYGSWPSPLTPAMLTEALVGLSFPSLAGGGIYWCEQRPQEGGRTTLLCQDEAGNLQELTPGSFNVRTRVHEYGGKPYVVAGDLVLVVDFAEQRLWRVAPGEAPVALTPSTSGRVRYADMVVDDRRRRLIAVEEEHVDGREPFNRLVSLGLDDPAGDRIVLHESSDFVAAPALDAAGGQLAWLAWDHPWMPWDSSQLLVAAVGEDGSLSDVRRIAGGKDRSVVQPGWDAKGGLIYLSDEDEFWLPYRFADGQATRLEVPRRDYAGPLWQLGMRWWGELGDGTLAMAYAEEGSWRLAIVDPASGAFTPLRLEASDVSDVTVQGMRILFKAGYADRPAEIICREPNGELRLVKRAGQPPLPEAWISRPRSLSFRTASGQDGHAFYYPPHNPEVTPQPGELPPLVVRIHGGPTSQTRAVLTSTYQFWTSRGFAILDVNYRGSSGFGRTFRDALRGQWGIADVEDCLSAASAAAEAGLADPDRLAIAGGSAGGFTTLAALTFQGRMGEKRQVFKAGASYYGVADLAALARDTHKFESRYLDQLVGPYPDRRDLYEERSPIAHIDELKAPTIFFQGSEDKVVPPNQAESMVAALRGKHVPTYYRLFPGEGHGFRQAATIEAVVALEYSFYMQVFAIQGGAPREPLDLGVPPAA